MGEGDVLHEIGRGSVVLFVCMCIYRTVVS